MNSELTHNTIDMILSHTEDTFDDFVDSNYRSMDHAHSGHTYIEHNQNGHHW